MAWDFATRRPGIHKSLRAASSLQPRPQNSKPGRGWDQTVVRSNPQSWSQDSPLCEGSTHRVRWKHQTHITFTSVHLIYVICESEWTNADCNGATADCFCPNFTSTAAALKQHFIYAVCVWEPLAGVYLVKTTSSAEGSLQHFKHLCQAQSTASNI